MTKKDTDKAWNQVIEQIYTLDDASEKSSKNFKLCFAASDKHILILLIQDVSTSLEAASEVLSIKLFKNGKLEVKQPEQVYLSSELSINSIIVDIIQIWRIYLKTMMSD